MTEFPEKSHLFHGKLACRSQLFLPVSKKHHQFPWNDERTAGRDSVFLSEGIGKATLSVLRRVGVLSAAGEDGAGIKCTAKHFRRFAATYFDSLLVRPGILPEAELVKYMRHSGSGSLKNYLADDVPAAVHDRLEARRVIKLPYFLLRI